MNIKKMSKKQLALLVALMLLLTISVGSTLAYIVTQTGAVNNTFTPADVTCEVNEPDWDDGDTVKSNVSIKNTGNTSAYIRATIVATWQDGSGNIASTPVKDSDYTLELKSNSGWAKSNVDGYYYYSKPVGAGESTEILISNCQLKEGINPPEGYQLCIEVIADAVQAEGVDTDGNHPVALAWGVTVADDGSISK